MDTKQLLTKAGEKLKETVIDFESDKRQFAEITKERGDLLALELIESKKENKEKITKLNKTIVNLKTIIEDTPGLINGLKKAKLRLASQKEKEEKEKAKVYQAKIEIPLNSSSQKLVELLKQVIVLNSELRDGWSEWDKLDKISGKGLTDKRCIRNSVEGIDKIGNTLINEFLGKSDGRLRKFYSKDRYGDTRLIF